MVFLNPESAAWISLAGIIGIMVGMINTAVADQMEVILPYRFH